MRVLGIDLGTTNTVGAIAGESVSLLSEQDSAILPSVVAFPPNGKRVVGTPARHRRAIDARNTIFSAKRLVGRSFSSTVCSDFRERYAFELIETHTGGRIAFKTRAGEITPHQVGSFVLEALVAEVPDRTAELHAVVAVPTGYDDDARELTRSAALEVGFGGVDLISEPVAAALAYGTLDDPALRRAAIYDLGGGTFELAVLDCATRPYTVLATCGDMYLGGDDIDQSIAHWAADQVLASHRWDLRDNALVFDRLVLECERAKIRLCYASHTTIDLNYVDPAIPAGDNTLTIGQERLQELADRIVGRSFMVCDEALATARVKAQEVDAVFLAGGTTQLPMVRRAISQYFDSQPRGELDPMEVIAIGASFWSGSAS